MKKYNKIAVIGAMEEEIETLIPRIKNYTKTTVAGFDFYNGELEGKNIILLKSGIGKVNAAVGTTILIERFAPDCIINTGSAGGFNPDLNVGDVVISSEVRHHDVDVTIFGYEMGQVPGMPAAYKAADDLIKIAETSIAKIENSNTVKGLICSGDSFMNCPERVAKTREHFPAMQSVEMEAAAIAQTCERYGTPFIVFRALSDIAGKESNISFDNFVKTAGVNSAHMVVEMVKAL